MYQQVLVRPDAFFESCLQLRLIVERCSLNTFLTQPLLELHAALLIVANVDGGLLLLDYPLAEEAMKTLTNFRSTVMAGLDPAIQS